MININIDGILPRISYTNNNMNMKLDGQTNVRVCMSSDIHICDISQPTPIYRGASANTTFTNIYCTFHTVYLPDLSIYFTTWAIRASNDDVKNDQYRLEVMAWLGGVPIMIRATQHLKEALADCISIIASYKYEARGGKYTINPVTEFKQAFLDSGWIEE